MKCPSCKETVLTMSERNGVEIDYCPDCRGVWLDRGELDKIIEKSKQADPAPQYSSAPPSNSAPPFNSAPQYNPNMNQPQPMSSDSYYKHKRKKSFLEEIFD